jgi:hypothetical protein
MKRYRVFSQRQAAMRKIRKRALRGSRRYKWREFRFAGGGFEQRTDGAHGSAGVPECAATLAIGFVFWQCFQRANFRESRDFFFISRWNAAHQIT